MFNLQKYFEFLHHNIIQYNGLIYNYKYKCLRSGGGSLRNITALQSDFGEMGELGDVKDSCCKTP